MDVGKMESYQVIWYNARILDYPTFHFKASDTHAEIKQPVNSEELWCLIEESVNSYYEYTIHEVCIWVI